jgi:tRNA (cytosine38-C5)-methyltransferase
MEGHGVDEVKSLSLNELRVIELYSGIGGMRFALRSALGINEDNQVMQAFDVNLIANQTYIHNFRSHSTKPKRDATSPSSLSIEYITSSELDKYTANIWMMSPPCQPYTKLGLQKGIRYISL